MKLQIDAIIVCNAEVSMSNILSLAKKQKLNSIAIISTHLFYPNEKSFLQEQIENIKFLSFADLLHETEMNFIDNKAHQELINVPPIFYVQKYESLINRLKNELVRQKVEESYQAQVIFCLQGLGIERAVWNSPQTKDISDQIKPRVTSLWERIISKLRSSIQLSLYRDGNLSFILLGTAKRIKFQRGARFTLNLPGMLSPVFFSLLKLIKKLTKLRLCCSIHDRYPLADYVFIDGYHPSNYPFSYLGSFRGDITFLAANEFQGKWFTKYGFKVEIRDSMLIQPIFREINNPIREVQKKRVLLLLNHAGDWAAIINRSDTERLIIAFCELAELIPDLEFVVRPHPTSIHFRHEGSKTIQRLRDYIEWLGIRNLKLSNSSLDEDIEAASLAISEYSLTLIDCYQKGKPALIANLTGRRSLMEDYQTFGFYQVETKQEMTEAVSGFFFSPDKLVNIQNRAIHRYNEMISG
ncbi:MAG: hypothetical protein CMQ38_01330 [Gammaproteobacteria bacterium]|nr:hypothetical protein [Gammaproteobacteria bacterium]